MNRHCWHGRRLCPGGADGPRAGQRPGINVDGVQAVRQSSINGTLKPVVNGVNVHNRISQLKEPASR